MQSSARTLGDPTLKALPVGIALPGRNKVQIKRVSRAKLIHCIDERFNVAPGHRTTAVYEPYSLSVEFAGRERCLVSNRITNNRRAHAICTLVHLSDRFVYRRRRVNARKICSADPVHEGSYE